MLKVYLLFVIALVLVALSPVFTQPLNKRAFFKFWHQLILASVGQLS
ncbi:26747_t:CDS:2 [Dentiscutata erythropus]|uniref:26747_t:CDS:1 n=1 Tax=Dentiscutata erythropus TaxID=1348616 RepID=A0A9N9EZX0_9GLOM|nr:26747_t:CDS:2 [Dentiscutata erythropus]